MKNLVCLGLTCLLLVMIFPLSGIAKTDLIDEQQLMTKINEGSLLMIEAQSGQVILSQNSETSFPILSITKILSAFVILDELSHNEPKLQWDMLMTAEGKAAETSKQRYFSGSPLIYGEKYSVRELFDAMMIESNNAATMLLGQQLAGDEQAFVLLLRKKASELGLTSAQIYTSTGLNKDDLLPFGFYSLEDGENMMNAQDVAFLSQAIIKKYPEILDVTKKHTAILGQYTSQPIEIKNSNGLVPGGDFGWEGITGLKTGSDIYDHTANVSITAEKEGITYIIVRLRALNPDARSLEVRDILEKSYKKLYRQPLVDQGEKIFGNDNIMRIKNGSQGTVKIETRGSLFVITDKTLSKEDLLFIPTNTKYDKEKNVFLAPIKKGEKLGIIVPNFSDLAYIQRTTNTYVSVEVYAAEDVGNGFWLTNIIIDLFD